MRSLKSKTYHKNLGQKKHSHSQCSCLNIPENISVIRFMIRYRPGGAAVEGQPDLWTADLFAPPDKPRSTPADKSSCRGWTVSKKQDKLIMGSLSVAAAQSKQLAILNTSCYTDTLYGSSVSQWTATETFYYPGAYITEAPAVLQTLHNYSSALTVEWESRRGLHMAGGQTSPFQGHKFSHQRQLHIWLKVHCRNRGIPCVNTFTAFSNSPQLFKSDALHPSHGGLVPFIDKCWIDALVRLSLLLVIDSKLRTPLWEKLSCKLCW